jgi:hypothetical protein
MWPFSYSQTFAPPGEKWLTRTVDWSQILCATDLVVVASHSVRAFGAGFFFSIEARSRSGHTPVSLPPTTGESARSGDGLHGLRVGIMNRKTAIWEVAVIGSEPGLARVGESQSGASADVHYCRTHIPSTGDVEFTAVVAGTTCSWTIPGEPLRSAMASSPLLWSDTE